MRNAFWSCESWGSSSISEKSIRSIKLITHTEVSNFNLSGICSQQITRFQVTMNNFLVVDWKRKKLEKFILGKKNLRQMTSLKKGTYGIQGHEQRP